VTRDKQTFRALSCGPREKAIHATLDYRGKKVSGGGKEWFKTTRDEIVSIYESVAQKQQASGQSRG
jgi:hypothetical protein